MSIAGGLQRPPAGRVLANSAEVRSRFHRSSRATPRPSALPGRPRAADVPGRAPPSRRGSRLPRSRQAAERATQTRPGLVEQRLGAVPPDGKTRCRLVGAERRRVQGEGAVGVSRRRLIIPSADHTRRVCPAPTAMLGIGAGGSDNASAVAALASSAAVTAARAHARLARTCRISRASGESYVAPVTSYSVPCEESAAIRQESLIAAAPTASGRMGGARARRESDLPVVIREVAGSNPVSHPYRQASTGAHRAARGSTVVLRRRLDRIAENSRQALCCLGPSTPLSPGSTGRLMCERESKPPGSRRCAHGECVHVDADRAGVVHHDAVATPARSLGAVEAGRAICAGKPRCPSPGSEQRAGQAPGSSRRLGASRRCREARHTHNSPIVAGLDTEVSISFPLDADGFLRRECPTCEREFQVASVDVTDAPEAPVLTEENDMRRVDFECHPSEPLKVLEAWERSVHCLVCGAAVSPD